MVPDAPYVTDLDFVDKQKCRFVVHGDDITSDSSGQDCYRFVKQAGRMKIVKRTPDISTTDLVGRMLLCTKQHHMKPLDVELNNLEQSGDEQMRLRAVAMRERIRGYATDRSGLCVGVQMCYFCDTTPRNDATQENGKASRSGFKCVNERGDVAQITKRPDQRLVYVDGSFDLFSSGHIEFLRRVAQIEREHARKEGWDESSQRLKRIQAYGEDYNRAFVVVGIHNDDTVNRFKGSNYPIMNIYERSLCVLQCKYIDAVVFGAPYDVEKSYLDGIPVTGKLDKVYHGKTNFFNTDYDGYAYPRQLGILHEVPEHEFQNVNAAQIYRRIIGNKEKFEERQRKKGKLIASIPDRCSASAWRLAGNWEPI